MDEVKIRYIREKPVRLHSPSGEYIGIIDNYLSYLDVLVQIKRAGVSGYAMTYDGGIIRINKDGVCSDYPDGFFDKAIKLLLELI